MTANIVVATDAETSWSNNPGTTVSPTGGYRAVAYVRSSDSVGVVRTSTDGGQTWSTAIAGPGNKIGPIAAWDNGTLHTALFDGTNVVYYSRPSGGSWSAGVTVAVGQGVDCINTDGTILTILIPVSSSTTTLYYSTNSGATWTSGGGPTFQPVSSLYHAAAIGGFLHITYNSLGGPYYGRWNLSTHAWDAWTGTSTWGSHSGRAIVMSDPSSTTSLYVVIVNAAPDTIDLFHSASSGANGTWSTVVTGQSIPSSPAVFSGGIAMGSDGLFHIYGEQSGPTRIVVCTRDTSAAGNYSAYRAVGPPPGSSGSLGGGSTSAVPIQRQDGVQQFAGEMYVPYEVTAGTTSPQEVIVLFGPAPATVGWGVGSCHTGQWSVGAVHRTKPRSRLIVPRRQELLT